MAEVEIPLARTLFGGVVSGLIGLSFRRIKSEYILLVVPFDAVTLMCTSVVPTLSGIGFETCPDFIDVVSMIIEASVSDADRVIETALSKNETVSLNVSGTGSF
jgi:hypothetical protein